MLLLQITTRTIVDGCRPNSTSAALGSYVRVGISDAEDADDNIKFEEL
jgi:hypothetical protein